jgi:V8-like Glu-specific endopeptidase
MRLTLNLLFTATLALATGGCGTGVELLDGEAGSRRAAIVNGELDNGHPAVGLLKSFMPGGYGLCTATVIGKKTLLTAAHCVYGTSYSTFTVGANTYQSAAVTYHPSYSDDVLNAFDVAVVVLAQEVSGIEPTPLAQTAPQVGQAITLVGFGVTSYGNSNSGTKRVTHNAISEVNNQYFAYSGSSGGEGNTCQGDSGGPSFRLDGGQEVLVGVHSTASVPCGYSGNDMRVDHFYSSIESTAGGDLAGADSTPPSVQITAPTAGATVGPSFTVTVTASDSESGLASIELYVDGALHQTAAASPASFSVSGLTPGNHNLRADVSDKAGNIGSTLNTVTVASSSPDPGDPPDPTPDPDPDPGVPAGGFGSNCAASGDCQTKLCANDTYVGASYCTQNCGETNPCPSGAECVPADGSYICAMNAAGGANLDPEDAEILLGSCQVVGLGHKAPLLGMWPLALLLILGLVLGRIRRSGRL